MLSDHCLSVTLVYCDQTVGCIKMKLGTQVGLGLSHIVLHGDPASPPPKGHSPQFLAHVFCGQMAGWTKIPLGTEVGLGPGDIVLDGLPPPKRGTAPNFWSMSIVAKWLYVSVFRIPLGTEVGLSLGNTVRWEPSFPSPKAAHPPIFSQCPLWSNGLMI